MNNSVFNKIFIKFLKDNNAYAKFIHAFRIFNYRRNKSVKDLSLKQILKQRGHYSPRDIFLDDVIISWTSAPYDFWRDLDEKWLKFYKKNKIYTKYYKISD